MWSITQPHYSWAAPRGSLSLLSTHSFTFELTTALLETVDKGRKNLFMIKSLQRMYGTWRLELNVTCLPHSPNRYMAPVVNYLIKHSKIEIVHSDQKQLELVVQRILDHFLQTFYSSVESTSKLEVLKKIHNFCRY